MSTRLMVSDRAAGHRLRLRGWIFAMLVVISAIVVSAQSKPSGVAQPTPRSSPTPVEHDEVLGKYGMADYEAVYSLPASQLDARNRISGHYDNEGWVQRNPHPETAKVGRVGEDPPPPLLPVTESDLVLAGRVVAIEAHMSIDKGSIYSEFRIQVTQWFKNRVGKDAVWKTVVADRVGGVVRYPDNRKVLYEDSAKGLPELGHEYLFFLKHHTDSDSFSILTLFELQRHRTVPLDRSRNTDEIEDLDKSDFIRLIESRIPLADRVVDAGKKSEDERLARYRATFPIVNYSESVDQSPERKRKGEKYRASGIGDADTTVDLVSSIVRDWEVGLSALPVDRSEIILIAEVRAVTAVLSSDKKSVYTEVDLKTHGVFKNESSKPLTPGAVIPAEREGGIVRFPSGAERWLFVSGQGMPTIGKTYLFFLTFQFPYGPKQNDDIQILTAYELSDGKVVPLDHPGGRTHPIATHYSGRDVSELLNDLKRALEKPIVPKTKSARP